VQTRASIFSAMMQLSGQVAARASGLEEVRALLRPLGLVELYFSAFETFGVDCPADLENLTDADWHELNVKPLHRRKIMAVLKPADK
jgi:hypothetical protein